MDYNKVFGLPDSVQSWIEALGLPSEVFQILEASGYSTLLSCGYLEEADVKELNIPLAGHRRTLLAGAGQLKSTLERIKARVVASEALPAFPHSSISAPATPSMRPRTPICNSAVPRGVAPDYWERARSRDRFQSRVRTNDGIHLMMVRHAQSLANVDMKYYTTHADYSVPLSEKGTHQAAESGRQVAAYYRRKFKLSENASPPSDWLCRIWTSPYVRARQTSQLMLENSGGWITDIQENVLLVEQNFGLFEGADWYSGELDDKYPDELHHYQKAAAFGGRFWAKIPLGESRFDVCMRVSQSFGTIHRDVSRCNIRNFVIVSHGTTLRAFMMMWNRLLPEWFEEEPNPSNASIRVIDDYQDEGYIWPPQDDDNSSHIRDNSLLHGLSPPSHEISRLELLDQKAAASNPLKEIHLLIPPDSHHHNTSPQHSAATTSPSPKSPTTHNAFSNSHLLTPNLQPHHENTHGCTQQSPGHTLTAFSAQYGGSEDALLRSSASIRPPSAKLPASPKKSTQE